MVKDVNFYFTQGADYAKAELFASAIHALAHLSDKLTTTERFAFAEGFNFIAFNFS